MPDKYHPLQGVLIAALLPALFGAKTASTGSNLIEQTLEGVQKCMAQGPAPWPEEWKREYVETIRRAIDRKHDDAHYVERLKVLRNGFGPYWESFTKTGDRLLFEVHRARIRWYVEHLMETEFPTEQERQRLRDQYTEIWDYALTSLLTQFPFLDPNAVHAAKRDDLSICYRRIETPLIPVYLRPFSEEQVAQIKGRWHDLRYARVDYWRSLGVDSILSGSNPKRDYLLTQKSLAQLGTHIWAIVAIAPDYYRSAMENQANAAKRFVQSKHEARTRQQRLEKERSRQLLQAEYISFLLAALLETGSCPDGSAPSAEQWQTGLEEKGGDAHEVEKGSREK